MGSQKCGMKELNPQIEYINFEVINNAGQVAWIEYPLMVPLSLSFSKE